MPTDYANELMPAGPRPTKARSKRALKIAGVVALFFVAAAALVVYLPRYVEARARYQRCRAGAEFNRAVRTQRFCKPRRADCVAPPEAAAHIDDEYRIMLARCKDQAE